ncbi:MAG: glycosylase, partial [Oscillospiraceae bacterium]|nr:glycosylase [Oscillospiraceae bacterium]
PGVPFLYYGDEIGMRYLADLPTKEGGYTRTGSRTPMQWDDSKNCGFSAAAEEDQLYLPVDEGGPSVKAMAERGDSLYRTLQAVLALRHREKNLQADGEFIVLLGEKDAPFIYRRGELLLAVNPKGEQQAADLAALLEKGDACPWQMLFSIGEVSLREGRLTMPAQSFAVLKR